MKICLINNLYQPYNRGGAERVLESKVKELKAAGHEVVIITTKPYREKPPANQTIQIYYLSSFYYNLNRVSIVSRFLWHIFNVFNYVKYQSVKKILAREKPDLVITHNLLGLGLLIPRAIRKLKIEHHHFLHDIQLLHPSGLMFYNQKNKLDSIPAQLYQFLSRRLLASPQKIISPSRWLLTEHLKRNFFTQSEQEIAPFSCSFTEPEVSTVHKAKEKTFIFVGQIEKHKGILLLIKAFKKLSANNRLIIVGSGRELNRAKRLANNDRRIEFRGRQVGLLMRLAVAKSSCLVVPSLCYENSPTVIYEAQALKTVVIAANLGGIPEIMTANDRLFKAGDINDLKEKMMMI